MIATSPLVWDASALHHAARADRIDVLADIASPYQNVTTAAVLDELAQHGLREQVTSGGWLEERRLDGLKEIGLLGAWLERLGAGEHHRGEVTVAVACQVLDVPALIDDQAAKTVMRQFGLVCHGTVWLAYQAVAAGRVPTAGAYDGFFTSLIGQGARFPFQSGPEWGSWALRHVTVDG